MVDSSTSQLASKWGLAPSTLLELRDRTIAAKSTAYCPYSRFQVGACLLTTDGAFIAGANVENASYPVGICGERTAMAKAITEGHKKFKALAVATNIAPSASPCGMCRQFIREFCDMKMPIFMYDKNGDCVVMTIEELLPMSFGPDTLPPPSSLPYEDA